MTLPVASYARDLPKSDVETPRLASYHRIHHHRRVDANRVTTEQSSNTLERDDFSSNRHPALTSSWSMIFFRKPYPPRIKCGAGLFGIMLQPPEATGEPNPAQALHPSDRFEAT